MPASTIRVLALAVIRRDDDLLVLVGHDATKDEVFHRPLGGGIEFGETGDVAVRRELVEELAAELDGVRYLGTLENVFTFDGVDGHEVVRLYDATLVNRSLYEREDIVGMEGTVEIPTRWLPLAHVRDGREILYPTGLLELLDQ